MTDKVIKLFPANDPDVVLEGAKEKYNDLLIIGWDKQGNLDARATTTLTISQCSYLVSLFNHKLLNGDYSE